MSQRLSLEYSLPDWSATEALGRLLAAAVAGGDRVLLRRPLGVEKTALVGCVLAARGHGGIVKSPTYTIVEEYEIGGTRFVHADFYRLVDAAELEAIGWRDYDDKRTVILVEWPERGHGAVAGDIDLSLAVTDDGRQARLRSLSPRGDEILKSMDR